MSNFLSAIYLRTGKLLCEPVYTDSHSKLLKRAGITECNTTAPVQQFVKLELTPPDKPERFATVSDWTEVLVDEHESPSWFDAAARFDAFEQMRHVLLRAMVSDSGMYFDGLLILCSDAAISCRGSRVFLLGRSSATLRGESSATLFDRSSATLFDRSSATLRGNWAMITDNRND